MFTKNDKAAEPAAADRDGLQKQLFEKIGQLTVERDFLKKAGETSRGWRRQLIEAAPEELSIRRCCELLGLNHSTLYYKEKPADMDDIDLLNAIYGNDVHFMAIVASRKNRGQMGPGPIASVYND